MKIFLDTAHYETIHTWAKTGLIDGVTTNPSHMSREGGDLVALIRKISQCLPEGHISVEVTEQAPEKVYAQAKALAALADNIVVKIPCHVSYLSIINTLVKEGVKINITLVFTLAQALCMSKLGVTYISPFVGRLDDIDTDGVSLLEEIKEMLDSYDFETQVLAASLRHVRHVHAAIAAGVDCMTLPVELLEKVIVHPLVDKGMEIFERDWRKLGVRNFP